MSVRIYSSEAFFRIQSVYQSGRSRAIRPALGYQTADRRAPQRSCKQSKQARAEAQAEDQETFRLGPRFSVFVDFLFLARFASDLSKGQSLTNDSRSEFAEAVTVIHILPIVKPECLLIDVAEQVEWLDANVRSAKTALQQTPEVFHSVGVHITA